MAYTGKGQQVNRTVLADVFGVSFPTIDRWVRDGMPVVQRGARGVEWAFNTRDVAAWLKDRAVDEATGDVQADESTLKKRKLAAETATAELALAKAKGEVAPLDQIERNLSKAFAEVRAGLRNVPGRTVSLLIGETDERRFKKILLEEIDQVLESLANMDLTAEESDDDDGDE